MRSNGHFYVALTVHALKQFVYPWIELVNEGYIRDASALDLPFAPFSFEFSLK